MTKNNNIVPFPKKEIESVVEELLELYKKGKVNNLILTYTVDGYKGYEHSIVRYWFAEKSCLYALGLIENMKSIVLNYMKQNKDETDAEYPG